MLLKKYLDIKRVPETKSSVTLNCRSLRRQNKNFSGTNQMSGGEVEAKYKFVEKKHIKTKEEKEEKKEEKK